MCFCASRQVRMRKISSFPSLSWEWTNPQTGVCFQPSPPAVCCLLFSLQTLVHHLFFLLERQKQTQTTQLSRLFQSNWFKVIPWSVEVFFFLLTRWYLYFSLQSFKKFKGKRQFSYLKIHTLSTGNKPLWISEQTRTHLTYSDMLVLIRVCLLQKTLSVNSHKRLHNIHNTEMH